MELNRQPIGLAGEPVRIKGDGRSRSIYEVHLSDTTSRVWRNEFNRAAPTAPDVTIHVNRKAVKFEATRDTLQSRLVHVRALIEHAHEATEH